MTTGLRERKKADTRAALAAAVLRLSVEKGFEHVTVEEVAAAADVSYRTFFNHFGSKEEALLLPDGADRIRLADRLAEQDPAVPVLAALRAAMQEDLARVQDDASTWRARFSVIAATPALLPRLVELSATDERALAESVAARTGADVDTDLHPVLVAAVVSAAVRAAFLRWHGGDRPLAAVVDEALDAVAAGLPTPTREKKVQ
ncbi:TetR family transcriptional regulator [Klenkia marina]|uniref:acyl-CoA-like ligand-binding transcription factor n=1 Tax=Klenkia marina TaxID=1960309 RepID=UPI001A9ECC38|nr:TetR family transcriptional regulator [Klenkia marina]